jgi:Ser/Thr protein kinase RdoA (MazF antagonist)
MMKLALMRQFFDACERVDGEWRSPLADAIAERWFDSVDVSVVRASSNFVTTFTHKDSNYYLRFNHETERSLSHINAEIGFINHLIERGIPANKPVPSIEGNLVESVESESGVFHAVLFEAVPGVHLESNELDLDGFKRWGATLGSFHNASEGLEIDDAPSWRDQVATFRAEVPRNPVLDREITKIEKTLLKTQVSMKNFGLIHSDFEMDNIKWVGDVPGFMDFNDCCHHWYASDIANALGDIHDGKMNGLDKEDPRFTAFIDGYSSIRWIGSEELKHIPLFIRLDKLYTYARVHRSISGGPLSDETEWVSKLRDKLKAHNLSVLGDINKNPIQQFPAHR